MCISPDAYVAARVTERLLRRGVDPAKAEAVGRKVARRYGNRRDSHYLAYLAGVPDDGTLTILRTRAAEVD